jgi:hypothetical protein
MTTITQSYTSQELISLSPEEETKKFELNLFLSQFKAMAVMSTSLDDNKRKYILFEFMKRYDKLILDTNWKIYLHMFGKIYSSLVEKYYSNDWAFQNENYPDPLLYACNQSLDDIIMLLVENSYDVNYMSKNYSTPVMFCVEQNNLKMFEFFLKNGARLYNYNPIKKCNIAYYSYCKDFDIYAKRYIDIESYYLKSRLGFAGLQFYIKKIDKINN